MNGGGDRFGMLIFRVFGSSPPPPPQHGEALLLHRLVWRQLQGKRRRSCALNIGFGILQFPSGWNRKCVFPSKHINESIRFI